MWISFSFIILVHFFLIFHFITSSHSSFFSLSSETPNIIATLFLWSFPAQKFSFILSAHKQPKSSQLKHSYTIKTVISNIIFIFVSLLLNPKHPKWTPKWMKIAGKFAFLLLLQQLFVFVYLRYIREIEEWSKKKKLK